MLAQPAPEAVPTVAESRCANDAPLSPLQLTHFTRFLSIPRDEFAQRARAMIDSQQLAHIGQPDLRVEGATSWGVWLCIFHTSGSSGNGHGRRVRCGVLYHVAQMTVFFHGDEVATRELLLPLFQHWTYTSIDALPQRIPDAPGSVATQAVHENGMSQATLTWRDGLPSQSDCPPGLGPHVPGVSQTIERRIAAIENSLANLSALPALLEQLIQGQNSLQNALSALSNCLGSSLSLRAVERPQASEMPPAPSHAGINSVPLEPALEFPHQPSGLPTVEPMLDVRVCRRASCRNSVADVCRTGYCARHCASQRCPCNIPDERANGSAFADESMHDVRVFVDAPHVRTLSLVSVIRVIALVTALASVALATPPLGRLM